MKKYITPNMNIRIFSDLTETAETTVSVATLYVGGLNNIEANNRAQVNLEAMKAITKFTF